MNTSETSETLEKKEKDEMFTLPSSIPQEESKSFFSSSFNQLFQQEVKSIITTATGKFIDLLATRSGIPTEQLYASWNNQKDSICLHVSEKGKKKRCDSKTANGEKYCTKHSPSAAVPARRNVVQQIVIGTNAYGNKEHEETGLIFNPVTQRVIGRQIASEVRKLTSQDLQECTRFGFLWDPEAVGQLESMTPQPEEILVPDQL